MDKQSKLRLMREASGLTVRQLAEAAGVSSGYITKLELGQVDAPSGEYVERLTQALGVGNSDILFVAFRVLPPDCRQKYEELPWETLKAIRGATKGEVYGTENGQHRSRAGTNGTDAGDSTER